MGNPKGNVKARNRVKLAEYIGNPDNEFSDRTEMAVTVLGYTTTVTLYRQFKPFELSEIEAEGFKLRKKERPEIGLLSMTHFTVKPQLEMFRLPLNILIGQKGKLQKNSMGR